MSHATSVISNSRKSVLLGTSALVCLALAAPVMADDFVITSGTTTNDGNTINGGDTVTVTGALTITGANDGIKTTNNDTEAESNTVTVTGTGSITTAGTGNNAYGIYNDGAYNTTTVSGSIKTAGFSANGIWNDGNNNETTVSDTGSIETGNDTYAHGIYNLGSTNTTTVSGSIKTEGRYAYGIANSGNSNKTTLSGSITTEGNRADGIYNQGSNNTTTVSGSIATKGTDADGIMIMGSRNTTTVSGSIKTEGTSAHGIDHAGSLGSNTTTISGAVKATGASSAALYNSAGSGDSFTLDEGAIIIGDIIAAEYGAFFFTITNSKLIFNLGASTSYAYSVSGKGEGTGAGQWTFSDLDGRTQGVTTSGTGCDTTITGAGNTVCNLVTGVSTGNLEVQDELQFSMNTSMIGSLSLGSSNSAAPVEALSFAQTPQNNAWANIYGDTSDRSASTTKLAFDGSNRGLTIGTPVSISDTLNLDLVFNASNANLDIGSAKEQQITAKSYNVGAVLRDLAPATGWAVDAFGFVGRNSYDGKRKVMNNQEATGSETVAASYSGMEVLVGVDAQYSNPINDTLNLIGGVNASLSNERIGAYSESKYYAWDARTMTQATGGITAGLEYHADALTTFASFGAQRSSLQNGKTAGYTNNGTAGSYTDSSNGDTYRTASVGFDYAGEDGMFFTGAVERFSSTGGVSGNSTSLSVNRKF